MILAAALFVMVIALSLGIVGTVALATNVDRERWPLAIIGAAMLVLAFAMFASAAVALGTL